jgi:methylglutamate dehydrogenase subunit C
MTRIASGGRVNRDQRVNFSLDGRSLSGYRGDTLASALLANGVKLIGRSFKYHRPRGFVSAGVDEPNGLFTLGRGGRTDPNVPGTITELFEGLEARCQNAWPSVQFDLMAVNSLASPLLSAGFYYKTFMGPSRGSWMFYEPFIRKAAGLGTAVHERDPDRYETRHAFADVLVIGGGPAGLSAAVTAGRAGKRVVLVEQDFLLGGSLLLEDVGSQAESWRRQMEQELQSLPNVEVLTRTTAFGLYDGNTVALVERRDARRDKVRQIVITLRAQSIVFATGATERPLVFRNNDLPGVMLTSAVRTYLNRFAVLCGKKIVVVTNNDSVAAAVADLQRAGAEVSVADLRKGVSSVEVIGGKAVEGIAVDGRRIDCDLVCMSGGWTPAVHLTSHCGIKPKYREDIHAVVPGGYAASQHGAGALNGTSTWQDAIEEGARAADGTAAPHRLTETAQPGYGIAPIWQPPKGSTKKAFVDFQNDVGVKDIEVAHQEGYLSVEHLKRYTTLGMGTDQGKTSNLNALTIMAGLRGIEIPAAGTTTFRPPFTPVAIGALAGRSIGKHFRATRRSPLHDWHIANGAQMIEAGPWLRAWWYRWAGDNVGAAYVKEMRLVRRAVGLSDVSTLGKIDVQGPDATELLNRVYVNGFAKLPVGKARYGVMLNDDGVLLDDGTTTRLSETRYFMTTTTAQAGEVMSWLEFLLQTAWTDLKVHVTSITDEWAAMVVSGPKARATLELAFPGQDVSDARLPYMGCLEFSLDRVPLRLIRLSFSGELAYEIYTPADYGVALWEHLLKTGAPLGIKPYGLEALASLRIEKGHVAGGELDHRNTLDDLGLGKMASKEKAFVGRELRQRPLLQAPERWSLIGIELLEGEKKLRGGSILFASGDEIKGHGRGYITSVTWSTELNKFIALGLYQGGLKHAGAEIICAFPLKNEQVRARIVSPMFIDPNGERLRV